MAEHTDGNQSLIEALRSLASQIGLPTDDGKWKVVEIWLLAQQSSKNPIIKILERLTAGAESSSRAATDRELLQIVVEMVNHGVLPQLDAGGTAEAVDALKQMQRDGYGFKVPQTPA